MGKKSSTLFLLFYLSLNITLAQSNKNRPVSSQNKRSNFTFLPMFYVGAQGGFMYSGIEWSDVQAEPVELVNILLTNENERSSKGLISTEKRPTYGHEYYQLELGFRSSFYQLFAYGGSGKFYQTASNFSRYGISAGLTIPIGRWLDIFGNVHFEKDNSMNGANLITLKYDDSLSPAKRAAAEKLIFYYKDRDGQGAALVTSQTATYWSAGARIKKTLMTDRFGIYIGGQYLRNFVVPDREITTTLMINGGVYLSF
jgi:hypothetical protein